MADTSSDLTGPPGTLAAQVLVRMRPPTGQVSYGVPVRLDLAAGPKGLTVLSFSLAC